MEFECQRKTEVDLLKNSVDFPQQPLKSEVRSLTSKELLVDISTEDTKTCPANKVKGAGNSNSESNSGHNWSVAVLSGSKLVAAADGISSGCRRSITDLPPALISEILNCLDPKELGIVSCVSAVLYKLASDHYVWKDFYCERWGLPIEKPLSSGLSDERTWKELFVERECRSRTFLGHYTRDFLSGHTDAVRTVFILASARLIFTSGYDSTVRMWDLEEGSCIGSSKPLGCTIRAVAADTRLLVVGGTNGFILCWRSVNGLPHLFDLRGLESHDTEFRLWEHEGPITSLAMDMSRIYSGSWDMTVRVWDRAFLKCVMVLRHQDWVYSLALHDTTLATAAGSDVYVWDTMDESPIAFIPRAHEGNIYALARSHTGEFLFTGGEDGSIHMFELLNCREEGTALKVATWNPHSDPVHSLAFEFPWLVSASGDGRLSLIDARKLLKSTRRSLLRHRSKNIHTALPSIEPPQRMLHGSGSNLFSVAVGADRIVFGGEEFTVKIWDFSQALEKERRSRIQRGIRLENRMRQRRRQFEINAKTARTEKWSVAAKRNPGDCGGMWHNKRGVAGKLKA